MDPATSPPPTRAPRHSPRLAGPLLLIGIVALVALAALIDWPKNEPAARRMLTLRAAELDGWLRQELLAPVERIAFSDPNGAMEAADPWREVVRALDGCAANAAAARPKLPPLAPPSALGASLSAAIGARRFTPFQTIDELASAEWLRAAHLLATLIRRAASTPDAPLAPWLDAALVLANDLRSTGLVSPALCAAELEEAVLARLTDDPGTVDVDALHALIVHSIASAGSLPPIDRVAERESRFEQASVCMRARVAPFDRVDEAGGESDEEPPWPLVMAAGAVDRLESYDERLREVLVPVPSGDAKAAYGAWVASFGRELPAAAALVADFKMLTPLRDAPDRLARIRAAAQRCIDAAPPIR